MHPLIFDIETGPLPAEELKIMIPPFDPAEVKVGNLKDPVKIREKIEEARANHEQNVIRDAALSALTCRILAIGLQIHGEKKIRILEGDEREILVAFWEATYDDHSRPMELVGFNICKFDLPVLFQRSWKHGIRPPLGFRRGRWWSDNVTDLRDIWTFGNNMMPGSIDSIAKMFGIPGKCGDGAKFAELYKADRTSAIAYLERDIEITHAIYERIFANQ